MEHQRRWPARLVSRNSRVQSGAAHSRIRWARGVPSRSTASRATLGAGAAAVAAAGRARGGAGGGGRRGGGGGGGAAAVRVGGRGGGGGARVGWGWWFG